MSSGTISASGSWHTGPTLAASGSVTFTRPDEASTTIQISGSLGNYPVHSDDPEYEYHLRVGYYITIDGRTVCSGTVCSPSENGSGSTSVNATASSDDSYPRIEIHYTCGESPQCTKGHPDEVVGSGYISLPYNPYKTPTIGCSTSYNISIFDQRREMWVDANYSGDDSPTTTWVVVNGNRENWNIGNSGGTYGFIPSQKGVSDGVSYTFQAYRQHNYATDKVASTSYTLYTYRTPIINSVSVDNPSFSGFGKVNLSWRTNARRWSTSPTEEPFKTYIRFNTSSPLAEWFECSNNNPTGPNTSNETSLQSVQITKDMIDTYFTVAERCQESYSTTVQMKRTNVSSTIETESNTFAITIQFAPKYAPNQINYWDYNSSASNNRGNSISPGTICYLDSHPRIVIDWSMPNQIDRGVIDGYELYIYSSSSYTTHKTFDVPVGGIVTDLYGQYVANIRSDLYRGQMNYVGVRAYYINPLGDKMYGPELRKQFVFPLGRLYTPKISYPVNNSRWHNKNFRILFELPTDDDYDVLSSYISNDTYTYKEIELTINGTVYKYTTDSNIFSINKMGYKYRVCVNPSILSSFPDTDTYRITVRVQKNYFMNIWSGTSSTTVVYKTPVTRQNLVQFTPILATHYKHVQSSSIRLYNTYPIKSLPTNNVDQDVGDVIYAKHYQAIFDTVLAIQDGVNTWARYDSGKDRCKFQQNIDEFSGSDKATNDLITAQDDERPTRQGRNYFNILVDSMNKLY